MMCALLALVFFLADACFLIIFSTFNLASIMYLMSHLTFTSTGLIVLFLFASAALRLLMFWCVLCSILEGLTLGRGY